MLDVSPAPCSLLYNITVLKSNCVIITICIITVIINVMIVATLDL